MPSPFPGMDPYLEEPSMWPDFHIGLIVAIRAALNERLPARYAAFADRYVWLHEPDADTRIRLGKPDYVAARTDKSGEAGKGTLLLAPMVVTLPVIRREGNRFVKLIDRQSRRVVTVIELLSPANKELGEDRDAYIAKRNECLATSTNLVEIDLLRSGPRLPMGEPIPPAADYYVMVRRTTDLPRAGIWALSIRDPLPPIPVPLRAEDGVVQLPLQACFERAYGEARYEHELNYAEPPDPPLQEPDATWARELLASKNDDSPKG